MPSWLLLDQRCSPLTRIVETAKEAELKGEAAIKDGDLDAAIANFNEAIRLDPKCVAAYSNRGFAYANKGRPDAQSRTMDEAADIDPKSRRLSASVDRRFSTTTGMTRRSQSIPQAIQLDPKCTAAYIDRAWCLRDQERM